MLPSLSTLRHLIKALLPQEHFSADLLVTDGWAYQHLPACMYGLDISKTWLALLPERDAAMAIALQQAPRNGLYNKRTYSSSFGWDMFVRLECMKARHVVCNVTRTNAGQSTWPDAWLGQLHHPLSTEIGCTCRMSVKEAVFHINLRCCRYCISLNQPAPTCRASLSLLNVLQVCFNAEEALQELQRFGLLVVERQQQQQSPPLCQITRSGSPATRTHAISSGAARGVPYNRTRKENSNVKLSTQEIQQQRQQQLYRVLGSAAAQQVLQQYWAGLLQQRVNSILRDV